MENKLSCFRFSIVILFFLIVFPSFAFAQRLRNIDALMWPAWVQAAGLIVVLLAAFIVGVFLYNGQKKQAVNREKMQLAQERVRDITEMQGLLCAVRHELAFVYGNYKETMREDIELARTGRLENPVPVEQERYYIYPVYAANIGKIKDSRLRLCILQAYTLQVRFFELIKWNNHLAGLYQDLKRQNADTSDDIHAAALAKMEGSLKKHASKMVEAFDAMSLSTKMIMDYINEDGSVSPRIKQKLVASYNFLNSPQSIRFR